MIYIFTFAQPGYYAKDSHSGRWESQAFQAVPFRQVCAESRACHETQERQSGFP